MDEGPDGYESAEASHRALRGIQRELERHPAVASVEGFPSGSFTQVVAQMHPERFGLNATDASLTVRWFAGETPASDPEFSFHFSGAGEDFGWHHEPNPHVDGWGHFQRRSNAKSEYAYEQYIFASTTPTRVVWDVLDRLSSRLDAP